MPVLSNPRHERRLDGVEKRMHHIAIDADAWWIDGMIVVVMSDARPSKR
jgi:hypothetical protein